MRRVLSLLLTVAMMLSLVVVAGAAESGKVDLVIEPQSEMQDGYVLFDIYLEPGAGVDKIGAFQFSVTGKNCTIADVAYIDKTLKYDSENGTSYFQRYGGTPITSIRNNTYTFLAAGTSEKAHSYTDEAGNTIQMPKHIWDTNLVKTKIVTLKVQMNDGAANCSLTVDTTAGSSGRFTVGKSVQDPTTGKYSVQDAFTGVATSDKYGADDVLLGDVDGSGEVDNIDAAMIYSYFNGFIEFTDEQLRAADVDGSGEVDNIDAAMVYSYFNGYLDTFPVAE